MTASSSAAFLPAIRPTPSIIASPASGHRQNAARREPLQRVKRIYRPAGSRPNTVYLNTSYIEAQQTKGRLIDLYA